MPQIDKAKRRVWRRQYFRKGGAGFEKHKARQRARRAKIQQWYAELKAGLRCRQCDEDHPACLDFHHRDPNENDGRVSQFVTRGWSKQRILAEIAKCDVLCSNCHRKLHALDANRNTV